MQAPGGAGLINFMLTYETNSMLLRKAFLTKTVNATFPRATKSVPIAIATAAATLLRKERSFRNLFHQLLEEPPGFGGGFHAEVSFEQILHVLIVFFYGGWLALGR